MILFCLFIFYYLFLCIYFALNYYSISNLQPFSVHLADLFYFIIYFNLLLHLLL